MSLYYRIRIWLADYSIDMLIDQKEATNRAIKAAQIKRQKLLNKFMQVHYG